MTTDYESQDRERFLAWERAHDSHPAYVEWCNHWSNKMTAARLLEVCAADPAKAKDAEDAHRRYVEKIGDLLAFPGFMPRAFERLFPDVPYTGSPRQIARVEAAIASKMNMRPHEVMQLALPDFMGIVDAIARPDPTPADGTSDAGTRLIRVNDAAEVMGISDDTTRRRLSKAGFTTLPKLDGVTAATVDQYRRAMLAPKDEPRFKLLEKHYAPAAT